MIVEIYRELQACAARTSYAQLTYLAVKVRATWCIHFDLPFAPD